MSSLSNAIVRSWPAINPHSTVKGNAAVFVLAWALLLAGLAVVLVAWTRSPLVTGLLFGAAAGAGLLALLAARARSEPARRIVPDVSLAAGLLEAGEELVFESHMPEGGVIFSDGVESDTLAFNSGAVAMFRAAERKTRLAAA